MVTNLMGQKSLVNQSFLFKKNLTTLCIPYIATAQFGWQMAEDRYQMTEAAVTWPALRGSSLAVFCSPSSVF
jgi:hypothetical protein